MEEREGTNNDNSFSLKQHEAYPMEEQPRPDNPNPFSSQPINSSAAVAENAAPPFSLSMPMETASFEQKKKRGRPRKYNPDGTLAVPFSSELTHRKRGRGRDNWIKKSQMFQFDRTLVDINIAGADFVGANFTPHVLIVNAGEDVTMKIMTFSQQGSLAICILSANGFISNVTLRHSTTSGNTLTYEGRFEILSLTGSFMQNDIGGSRSRSGGMSVCLAGPDGRVFGGGLAGLFLAASPVQVMLGTFIAVHEQSQRQRLGAQPSPISFNITAEERKARFERINNSVVMHPPPPPTHETTMNAVHGYYTNSVNHSKDHFGGGEEDDDDELEHEEEEFGDDSQSDKEIQR